MPDHNSPVFTDHTGRRWRRIRLATLVVGGAALLFAGVLIAAELFTPPIPPERSIADVGARADSAQPHAVSSRRAIDPARLAYRRHLAASLRRYQSAAPHHDAMVPAARDARPPKRSAPIVAGFYVNWADNSLASLTRNVDKLDWVVGEWAFIPANADTLLIRIKPEVLDLVESRPAKSRPELFLMLSNFVAEGEDSSAGDFDSESVRRFLGNPVARANAVRQLRAAVVQHGLAGTTLDIENFAPDLHANVLSFARELQQEMHAIGRLSTQAVAVSEDDDYIRRAAEVNDRLFPMLFDEHYSSGDAGPVASQRFFVTQAERFARLVDPSKLIFMVGAYGYDWNDRDAVLHHRAEAVSFQEIMRVARGRGRAQPRLDAGSLNPFIRWTDADSTEHVVWYLDAISAYNQMLVGHRLGAAGHAIWRLGGEDPSLWRAIGADGTLLAPDSLRRVPPGYDTEFEGTGEILQITGFPSPGRRDVTVDERTALITRSSYAEIPVPHVIERIGGHARNRHRVAITFDDGPDSRWTPMILDTLRSRGVKATFFVIGENVDDQQALLRRMYREGHELGNHTYRHPNLGLTSAPRTVLELDMTEQLVSTLLERRMAFFRPPYFGDAEPTTSDELVPVGIASRRNYWTIGLHVDSEDWRVSDPDSIVANVLRERAAPRVSEATAQDSARSIVLMHDSGGDRSATVRALGPLIDSLRARGDTLVLVSALAGLTRDESMPPMPTMTEATRLVMRAGFTSLGVAESILYWVFATAVALGMARLLFIGVLAIYQRLSRHQVRHAAGDFAPGVSIIVPAYNEEKVILQTIASLIAQTYAGPLEIVVVDDGSRDATMDVVVERYGGHPLVSAYRKENGGKASALNFGIARAQHEIVIALDADTLFDDDTVAELVQPLADPWVGAVAGNAKVGNRINLVTRWQALEYVISQNFDRRAFSLLDCITVVPGAVGAWRRSLVLKVGGFKEDTLAEDQDLTLAIRREGLSVAYADGAVAYTEAPDTLRGLAKQRFRWSFGTLQCTWKHRDAFFRRRYGSLGFIGLPNVFLFQLLLPVISPVADLMFVWSLVSIWMNASVQTANERFAHARQDFQHVLWFYAIFLIVDFVASVIAFVMEEDEDKSLTWLIFLQRFAYRQVMYWVVLRSFAAALRGRLQGWGKLERKATVSLPEHRRGFWTRLGDLLGARA